MDKQQIGGMFGPTEDEVRTAIDTQGRADIQTLFANARNPLMLVAGNMADAGRDFGRMFESAAGYEDPRVRKAQLMQQVKQRVLSSGITPNDPIAFARASAQEFARVGLGDEAMGAAQFAKQMQDKADEFAWQKEKFGTETDTAYAKMRSEEEQARILANARIASAGGEDKWLDYSEPEVEKLTAVYVDRLKNDPELRKRFGYGDINPFNQDETGLKALARRMALTKHDLMRRRYPGALAEEEVYRQFTRTGTGEGPPDKQGWLIEWFREHPNATPPEGEAAYKKRFGAASGPVDAVDKAATAAAITGPKSGMGLVTPQQVVEGGKRAVNAVRESNKPSVTDAARESYYSNMTKWKEMKLGLSRGSLMEKKVRREEFIKSLKDFKATYFDALPEAEKNQFKMFVRMSNLSVD